MRTQNFFPTKLHFSDGQGLVEFALVLPILVLILLGVLDLGLAIYANTTVSNTAREGARAAVVGGNVNQAIQTTAIGVYSSNSSVFTYTVSSPITSGNPVTVTVSYSFTAATPFIGQYLGTSGQIVIRSTASMIAE